MYFLRKQFLDCILSPVGECGSSEQNIGTTAFYAARACSLVPTVLRHLNTRSDFTISWIEVQFGGRPLSQWLGTTSEMSA